MISYSHRFALFLIASCALSSWANAQNKPETPCPSAQGMKAEQLHGLWAARFSKPPAGLPELATLLLERHAEFSESLAGRVSRDLGAAAGAKAIAGHTAKAELEWQRIVKGARLARSAGLEVHAGHGLDYKTAETISGLSEIAELNIGYFMIGEALFVGLAETVRAMRSAMDRGRRTVASKA